MREILSGKRWPVIRFACCLSLVADVLGSVAVASSGTVRYGFPHIRHVVIILQDDRSFDNLFHGFPGADTQNFGYTSTGKRVTLHPLALNIPFAINHQESDFVVAFDGGRNDRFDLPDVNCTVEKCRHLLLPQYSFVPPSQMKRYTDIAKQYVLGDRMFGSTYAGTFELQLQLVTGQDYVTIGHPSSFPWGCDNMNRFTVVYRLPPRKP